MNSTDKIMYQPQEGTTGFWGLRLEPCGCQCHQPGVIIIHFMPCCENGFRESSKLELVNPDELNGHGLSKLPSGWLYMDLSKVKPGDIFSLPIGYGFEEKLQVGHSTDKNMWFDTPEKEESVPDNCYRTVLRLVKLSGTTPASEVNSVCNFTEDRNYPEAILFAEWLLREKTTEYLVGDFQGEMEEVYKEFIQRKKT